ncbi:MAG TPA: YcxB family protein, partial [Candidatus Acidoferrales bacterium]|nr:YcxB family protein [Candidatus Acidoferrales bacterium]
AAVAAAFYYFWFVWRSNMQFRKKFSHESDATAVIDDRGITLTAGVGQKTHLWVGFTRIYESKRVVVMEKGGEDFIYLPRSAMSTAQLVELKRLAANTIDCRVAITSPLA